MILFLVFTFALHFLVVSSQETTATTTTTPDPEYPPYVWEDTTGLQPKVCRNQTKGVFCLGVGRESRDNENPPISFAGKGKTDALNFSNQITYNFLCRLFRGRTNLWHCSDRARWRQA